MGCRSHSQIPGKLRDRLSGDVLTESQTEMYMHPPEESTRATHEALHAIEELEQNKHHVLQRQMTAEDVQLFSLEKEALRTIVRKSLAPLRANLGRGDV